MLNLVRVCAWRVRSYMSFESTQNSICHHRLVVRTGRCGRPDGGSILPGDIFLIIKRFKSIELAMTFKGLFGKV